MRHHFAEENIADASLGRLLRRMNATTGGFGVQPRRRQRTQQTPAHDLAIPHLGEIVSPLEGREFSGIWLRAAGPVWLRAGGQGDHHRKRNNGGNARNFGCHD